MEFCSFEECYPELIPDATFITPNEQPVTFWLTILGIETVVIILIVSCIIKVRKPMLIPPEIQKTTKKRRKNISKKQLWILYVFNIRVLNNFFN